MTQHTKIKADRRAQIFALLRNNSDEAPEALRPRYVDDATTRLMLGRAQQSFRAPPVALSVPSKAQKAAPIPDAKSLSLRAT
ncbi:MAG: hypothetical protein AAF755_13325 [Pseudomonadota bacterium]